MRPKPMTSSSASPRPRRAAWLILLGPLVAASCGASSASSGSTASAPSTTPAPGSPLAVLMAATALTTGAKSFELTATFAGQGTAIADYQAPDRLHVNETQTTGTTTTPYEEFDIGQDVYQSDSANKGKFIHQVNTSTGTDTPASSFVGGFTQIVATATKIVRTGDSFRFSAAPAGGAALQVTARVSGGYLVEVDIPSHSDGNGGQTGASTEILSKFDQAPAIVAPSAASIEATPTTTTPAVGPPAPTTASSTAPTTAPSTPPSTPPTT